jgi:hypothetical protein
VVHKSDYWKIVGQTFQTPAVAAYDHFRKLNIFAGLSYFSDSNAGVLMFTRPSAAAKDSELIGISYAAQLMSFDGFQTMIPQGQRPDGVFFVLQGFGFLVLPLSHNCNSLVLR